MIDRLEHPISLVSGGHEGLFTQGGQPESRRKRDVIGVLSVLAGNNHRLALRKEVAGLSEDFAPSLGGKLAGSGHVVVPQPHELAPFDAA